MELIYKCDESGMQAVLIRGLGLERKSAEREILERGLHLPLCHRSEWAANLARWEPWFVLIRDAQGNACGGVAIEDVHTRALPGYTILRVRRFGGDLPVEACCVALKALASLARKTPRVLRLQLNVFSRNRRAEIGETLEKLGLRGIQPPSTYRHTLAIDLRPGEEVILASFNRNARRRIRESMAMSMRSQVITDPVYAKRLQELQEMALQRTKGHIESEDWQGALKLSRDHPALSTIIGIFSGESSAPENMGAFGWACNNGDHVEYFAAGTEQGDGGKPWGYPLAWEIIRWAKSTGAEWFDMGGVTLEGEASPFEGISRFKRYFSRELVEVGAEWTLEPAPRLATALNVVSHFRVHVLQLAKIAHLQRS